MEGDATDDATLRAGGIARAKGLFATIDSDAQNVYVILSARALNPGLFVVGRASTPAAEEKLARAGADRVVSPYTMAGRRLAELAVRPRVVDFLDAALSHGERSSSRGAGGRRTRGLLARRSVVPLRGAGPRARDPRGATSATPRTRPTTAWLAAGRSSRGSAEALAATARASSWERLDWVTGPGDSADRPRRPRSRRPWGAARPSADREPPMSGSARLRASGGGTAVLLVALGVRQPRARPAPSAPDGARASASGSPAHGAPADRADPSPSAADPGRGPSRRRRTPGRPRPGDRGRGRVARAPATRRTGDLPGAGHPRRAILARLRQGAEFAVPERAWGYFALFSEIGLVLLVTVLVGVLGGYWVDQQLRTLPIFVLVGLFVGLGVGARAVYRLISRFLATFDD